MCFFSVRVSSCNEGLVYFKSFYKSLPCDTKFVYIRYQSSGRTFKTCMHARQQEG